MTGINAHLSMITWDVNGINYQSEGENWQMHSTLEPSLLPVRHIPLGNTKHSVREKGL